MQEEVKLWGCKTEETAMQAQEGYGLTHVQVYVNVLQSSTRPWSQCHVCVFTCR